MNNVMDFLEENDFSFFSRIEDSSCYPPKTGAKFQKIIGGRFYTYNTWDQEKNISDEEILRMEGVIRRDFPSFKFKK